MKSKKFLLIGLLILALVIIIFGVAGTGEGFLPEKLITPADKVKCYITVGNPWFFDMELSSVTCLKTGSCYQLFYLGQPTSLQYLFKDVGYLALETVDKSEKIYIEVTEGSHQEYLGEICTLGKEGKVTLFDEEGKIVDSKEVSW